jgi:hypothetical protein
LAPMLNGIFLLSYFVHQDANYHLHIFSNHGLLLFFMFHIAAKKIWTNHIFSALMTRINEITNC